MRQSRLPYHAPPQPRTRWMRRVLPAAAAVAMGMVAFQIGVGTDARPDMPQVGWVAHLYAVCTLFVLGGLDLGFPTGSNTLGRCLLWLAYFLAPIATTIAVVEAFLASLQPGWWRNHRLRDHVVVVGGEYMGLLYLEALREEEPKASVIIVDQDPTVVEIARHFGVGFLNGDVRRSKTREALCLDRARGVIVMTRDDLVNLAVATDMVEEAPNLAGKLVVHVRDLGFKRALLKESGTTDGLSVSSFDSKLGHIFNAHRVAAQHLVEQRLRAHFARTDASDLVVLAGFGRFNQTILETLQDQASGEFHGIVIVDVQAEVQARSFDEQVGFGSYKIEVIEGDMNDPEVWRRVNTACGGIEAPAYVLGSDDDSTNLRVAMSLQLHHPSARVFVRCFDESAFTRRLAMETGFEVSAVATLMRASLRVHHREWFSRT